LPQRYCAPCLYLCYNRSYITGFLAGSIFCLNAKGRDFRFHNSTPITAKNNATGLCGGQCRLGTGRDRPSLLLSHKRHHTYRQAIGKRHLGTDKINARLLKPKQEMSVAT